MYTVEELLELLVEEKAWVILVQFYGVSCAAPSYLSLCFPNEEKRKKNAKIKSVANYSKFSSRSSH